MLDNVRQARGVFQSGVTIVEFIVATTLASIVILGMIPLLVYMFSVANSSSQSIRQASEVQGAMEMVLADIQIARRFYDRSYEDTYSPRSESDNYWRFESEPRSLILQLPATDRPYQDEDRRLVYDSTTGICGYDAQPHYVQAIYYLREGSLYRRTLLPEGSVPCGDLTVHQERTCMPDSGCGLSDVKVLDDVSDFNVDYFVSASDEHPDESIFSLGGTGIVHSEPYRAVSITLEQTIEINDKPSVHGLTYRGVISWQ